MQALILAGGRGMRLSPLTDDVSSSLLYLPGGTVLDYLLHQISELPIRKRAILLQYRGDQVAWHLRHREDIETIPQYAPFTLLSALASAAPWVEEPTLVLHGNQYFSHSLHYFLEEADPTWPTFLLPEEEVARGKICGGGAYLLPPETFYLAARLVKEDCLGTLYKELVKAGTPPAALPLKGWARCITRPDDLLTVNRYLLANWHEAMHPPEAGIGYDAINFNWISPEAEVQETSGLFVTIGPQATVHGSRLYNTLVFPSVRLEGAREQNAVIVRNSSSLLRLYSPLESIIAS